MSKKKYLILKFLNLHLMKIICIYFMVMFKKFGNFWNEHLKKDYQIPIHNLYKLNLFKNNSFNK